MIGLTRKTDYGLVALAYLADRWHKDAGAASARQIADAFGMPLPLLMNILKQLSAAKILISTRGVHGGYALAMEPAAISLLDVVTAMEGPIRFAMCVGRPELVSEDCPLACQCPISGAMQRLQGRLTQFFDHMTLQDLIGDDQPEVLVSLKKVGLPTRE